MPASRSSWSPAPRARARRKALQLAQAHPGLLYATAGVHPHHASEYTDECDAETARAARASGSRRGRRMRAGLLPRLLAAPGAAARVRAAAADRVDLAVDGVGKPLFLHQRDAHADFMAVMRNFDGQLGPAVVHCFTGDARGTVRLPRPDWHVGITGWLCDERRGQHLRELVKHIPANRLMIETDAPYLLPRTVKPQPSHRRNEPMYLAHIVEELARDRGEDVETVAAATTANAARASSGLPD